MLNLKQKLTSLLFINVWVGWQRWTLLLASLSIIFLLGIIRVQTEAEFAFASLALLPVIAVAWFGGKAYGVFLAFIASIMWLMADITTNQQFSLSWAPWANALTRLATYSLVAFLVAIVRQQLVREREQATHDVLTGLQNRRAFLEKGNAEVVRSKRYSHPLALFFLDLDNFKSLNDTKGHDVGDEALRATARALQKSLRASDQIARLGGDEFAAILPEIDYDSAVETMRKVHTDINNALLGFAPVKVSIGVACFEKAEFTFSELLKSADELMYEVKASGKGNMLSKNFKDNISLANNNLSV